MIKQKTKIYDIPALIWGAKTDKVFLFIHGQGGNKEEASILSDIVCNEGWQVLSIDLPEHGERKNTEKQFYPWVCVPELVQVMEYIKSNWRTVSLYANSIGAWFSMLAFQKERLNQSLFVSPVVDMEKLICTMMLWAGVTERQLAEEKLIPTNFGQTLSWQYLCYVREHPIAHWDNNTHILYAGHDNMVDRNTIDMFAQQNNCHLTVMENGAHWFHTPEQLHFLTNWIQKIDYNNSDTHQNGATYICS